MALVNNDNENNKLVLLINGNTNLKCNGENEGTNVIRHGLQLDAQYHLNSIMKKAISNRSWTDEYHSFELSWSPGNVSLGIDGFSTNFRLPNLLQVLFHSKVIIIIYSLKNNYFYCINILIYTYLELFFYWCVGRWDEKFCRRLFQ